MSHNKVQVIQFIVSLALVFGRHGGTMLVMLCQHLVLVRQPERRSERALRWNTTSLGHSANEEKVECIGVIILSNT